MDMIFKEQTKKILKETVKKEIEDREKEVEGASIDDKELENVLDKIPSLIEGIYKPIVKVKLKAQLTEYSDGEVHLQIEGPPGNRPYGFAYTFEDPKIVKILKDLPHTKKSLAGSKRKYVPGTIQLNEFAEKLYVVFKSDDGELEIGLEIEKIKEYLISLACKEEISEPEEPTKKVVFEGKNIESIMIYENGDSVEIVITVKKRKEKKKISKNMDPLDLI